MNCHTYCNSKFSYKKLRWDKADRMSFYSYTGIADSLSGICDKAIDSCNGSMDANSECQLVVDHIYNELVTILRCAANLYVPQTHHNYVPNASTALDRL